jgi:ABC-2 type transport system ATP-binding protein
VEADGADPGALDVLRRLGVVDDVTTDGRTITIATPDGSSAIHAVAVALSTTGLEVTSLTVRTPTLDDVFRQLTGAPIEGDGPRR